MIDRFLNKTRESTSVQAARHQKQETSLSKTLHAHENHTLFEIDVNTGEVRKATFNHEKSAYIWRADWKPGDKVIGKKGLIAKEGKHYVLALNAHNALKKFQKGIDGNKFTNDSPLKIG